MLSCQRMLAFLLQSEIIIIIVIQWIALCAQMRALSAQMSMVHNKLHWCNGSMWSVFVQSLFKLWLVVPVNISVCIIFTGADCVTRWRYSRLCVTKHFWPSVSNNKDHVDSRQCMLSLWNYWVCSVFTVDTLHDCLLFIAWCLCIFVILFML